MILSLLEAAKDLLSEVVPYFEFSPPAHPNIAFSAPDKIELSLASGTDLKLRRAFVQSEDQEV